MSAKKNTYKSIPLPESHYHLLWFLQDPTMYCPAPEDDMREILCVLIEKHFYQTYANVDPTDDPYASNEEIKYIKYWMEKIEKRALNQATK